MTSIVGELSGDEPISVRLFRKDGIDLFELVPIARRREVYLKYTRIGCQAERPQPEVCRRRITLNPDRHLQIVACFLDG